MEDNKLANGDLILSQKDCDIIVPILNAYIDKIRIMVETFPVVAINEARQYLLGIIEYTRSLSTEIYRHNKVHGLPYTIKEKDRAFIADVLIKYKYDLENLYDNRFNRKGDCVNPVTINLAKILKNNIKDITILIDNINPKTPINWGTIEFRKYKLEEDF